MSGQRGLHVVRVVLHVVVFQDRVNTLTLVLPALCGRAALVVRGRLGSSACCPGGSLLDSMISSIVFLTDASGGDAAGLSSFAFALGLALAFGVAVPKAPPCGPPDGGSICGTVDFVVIRVRFGAGA